MNTQPTMLNQQAKIKSLNDSTIRMKNKDSNRKLLKKLGIDFLAASGASLMASPFITAFDRSMTENANGKRKLSTAFKEIAMDFIRSPHRFICKREFLIVFGLYTSTYVSANTIDTICEVRHDDHKKNNNNNEMYKFLGTSIVNLTLCIAKDREFIRMFGVIVPAGLPPASYGLFAIRDCLTIAASFNLPKDVSNYIQQDGKYSKASCDTFAQIVCPAAVQFISTPLHLLGLDLYNHKDKSMSARAEFVSREYGKSTSARIGRIIPAFGVGGVGNKFIRDNLRRYYLN